MQKSKTAAFDPVLAIPAGALTKSRENPIQKIRQIQNHGKPQFHGLSHRVSVRLSICP